ncbi:MAG TPA: hypothetical protein VMF13_01160, partial [Luteitalea sp.]|nr:hypothetical protein [Luteitalea sp.]
GTPVTAYHAVLTKTAASGLDGSVQGSETLYITSDNLLRAIVVPVSVRTGGTTFKESITIVFSNYGAPVTVNAPPASEVVTYAQFEAAQNGRLGEGA